MVITPELAEAGIRAAVRRASILDSVPIMSPLYMRPSHMRKLANILRRMHKAARGEGPPVLACLSAPPQVGKPLHEDTLVTMADGSRKAIRDVRIGDRVISGGDRVTTVTATYEQGTLPVLRITTRSGREVVAEASHRFLTQDGWKRADELRPYDRSAWQRPRGDALLVLPTTSREARSVGGIDVARFLGYMIGDGNTTQSNCRWTNIDPECRASFVSCVTSLGGECIEDTPQTFRVNSNLPRLAPEELRRRAAFTERAWRRTGARPKRERQRHHSNRGLLCMGSTVVPRITSACRPPCSPRPTWKSRTSSQLISNATAPVRDVRPGGLLPA
jgi:hypothetical protein